MKDLVRNNRFAIALLIVVLWFSLFISSQAQTKVQSISISNAKELKLRISIERLASDTFTTNAFYFFLKANNSKDKEITLIPASVNFEDDTPILAIQLKSIGFLIEAKKPAPTLINGVIEVNIMLQNPLADGDWEINAYSIAMNKIKEGSFYAGDGSSNNTLHNGNKQAILINEACDSVFVNNQSFPLNSTFPKGINSFYVMQQEISQGLFCAYLNSLPKDMIEARYSIVKESNKGYLFERNRNTIVYEFYNGAYHFSNDANNNGISNEENDGLEVACNFLNLSDLLSILDWMGLRPLSELEYEKIARGFENPKPKEMAFGTQIVKNANTLQFANTNIETAEEKGNDSAGLANHAYPAGGDFYLEAPFRSGFAFQKGNHRVRSGAGYFGTADLSGNLWEQCVKILHTEYKASLGDGNPFNELPEDWKAEDYNLYMPKGGAWLSLMFNDLSYPFRDLAISDRFYQDYNLTQRVGTIGGRGAL